MADEPVVVQGINWKETFPFTLIFRGFRIAIHPSKLVLALLALVSIYLGGWVLDAIWPASFSAVENEIGIYEETWRANEPTETFVRRRDEQFREVQQMEQERLARIGRSDGGSLRDIRRDILQRRGERVREAQEAYERSDRSRAALDRRNERIRGAYVRASAEYAQFAQVDGIGLFDSFYSYQVGQINRAVHAVRQGVWMGPNGVFEALVNFFIVGPSWAVRHHPFYFTLFGIFFLMIWAVFGGAIARIAAVHVARDEKISIRQALAFSTSKFLSFVSAPIIPLLIVLVVGLIVAIGGLIGNIPWLGPILVGALFFLALAAGFIMTLVLLGLAGGFNLMYPTIAVEGSDSFDAISRSFSYLYARPWRLAFYTLIALVYGAITYLFVRFFIKLLLYLTHTFAGLFFFTRADSTSLLWPTMWPYSLHARLSYEVDYLALGPAQSAGAFLLSFWVYLTIGMLGAFAISFYFSANTIIYFLMRNEVDATELDDVYLEQAEEEFAETAVVAPGAAPVAGTDVAPAPPTPEPPEPTPPRAEPPPPEDKPPPV